jgi:hypothetical protein
VDAVAAKTGDSKVATGETIDALIATITAAVTKGDTVQLIGFGFVFDRRTRYRVVSRPRALVTYLYRRLLGNESRTRRQTSCGRTGPASCASSRKRVGSAR